MSRARQVERSKSVDVLFQQAQRWFQKLDFKQALKDARLLIRQDPSPAHRQFLEEVSIARAKELVRGNLKDQAQAVLEEILTAPITSSKVKEQLPDVLLAVGWLERYPQYKPQSDPDSQARFLARGVDAAIVRGQPAPAEMREGVELVRQAIARLEAGDEEPLAGLKEIPRNSPLADWRLFLRGFAAFSRNEIDEAQSAWERLDAERIAARMAKGLLAQRSPELLKDADYTLRSFVAGLEKLTSGSSVLHVLRMVQAAIARNEWTEALNLVSRQRLMLRAADPEILQRFTAIVFSKAIHARDRDLLRDLVRCSDPLTIDPAWSRAWALMFEADQERTFEELERHWQNYLRDLETAPGLSDEERKLAQAMTLEHLATEALDCYGYREEAGPDAYEIEEDFEESQTEFRAQIFNFLRQSLELAGLKSTYKVLLEAYEDEDNQPAMIRTCKELLEKHPDDQDSIVWLAHTLTQAGQVEEALHYARDAFRRKPLDLVLKDNLWKTLRNRVRECIRADQFPLAREFLQEAAQYQPDNPLPFAIPGLEAFLTLREGKATEADALFKQAETAGAGKPLVYLVLIVDSVRLKTPASVTKRFEAAWLKSLKAKFDPEAAVMTMRMIQDYKNSKVPIPSIAERMNEFQDYLSRGLRSKFEEAHLEELTGRLFELPEVDGLLKEKYLNKAIKSHPQNPLIVMAHVRAEIEKGPRDMKSPGKLMKMVEKVGDAIHAGNNAEHKKHLPALETLLDTLERLNFFSGSGLDLGAMFDAFQRRNR